MAIKDVPWGGVFAMVSLFSLIALVVMALWRLKLKPDRLTALVTHIALTGSSGGHGTVPDMLGWAFYLSDPWKRTSFCPGSTGLWIVLLLRVRIVEPLFMLAKGVSRCAAERRARQCAHAGDAARTNTRAAASAPGQFGWLTLSKIHSVEVHRASFLVLVQCRRHRRTCRDDDKKISGDDRHMAEICQSAQSVQHRSTIQRVHDQPQFSSDMQNADRRRRRHHADDQTWCARSPTAATNVR